MADLSADFQHLREHRRHIDRYLFPNGLEPKVEPIDVINFSVIINVRVFKDGPDYVDALP